MKILVAIDQSGYSQKALEHAVAAALKDKAELFIVSVDEQHYEYAEFAVGVDIEDKFTAIARAIVDKAVDFAKSKGLVAHGELIKAVSAAGAIIDLAKAKEIDLIVVGSRGRGAIERFLLGSVATRIVTHAACSVLVVR